MNSWRQPLLIWLSTMAIFFLVLTPVQAHDISIDEIDWKTLDKKMKKLSPLGFHPFLMPLIMDNRDAIGLTKEQIKDFKDWRNKNRVQVMNVMNKILKLRNEFLRLSLSPNVSNTVLEAKQEEIFKLHRKVLKYQLSCRRNILDNFNEEQWDNFYFVLGENGYDIEQ
ncbi:MAG: hypothetical protein HQL46_15265 [Gammaproteobacteria bacterium]|nr:hypothetical protein [Gammaproteobacteria bacterium]